MPESRQRGNREAKKPKAVAPINVPSGAISAKTFAFARNKGKVTP
jgi:hypothetical protein